MWINCLDEYWFMKFSKVFFLGKISVLVKFNYMFLDWNNNYDVSNFYLFLIGNVIIFGSLFGKRLNVNVVLIRKKIILISSLFDIYVVNY